MRSLTLTTRKTMQHSIHRLGIEIGKQAVILYSIKMEKSKNRGGREIYVQMGFIVNPTTSGLFPRYPALIRSIENIKDKVNLQAFFEKEKIPENHQKILDIVSDQPRQEFYNTSKITPEKLPLVVFNLTQLGPSVLHIDDRNDLGDDRYWREISVSSMIQSSRKLTYVDGVNHIHISEEGDSLLMFSLIFRDKEATDKRLRALSLLQIGLILNLEIAEEIPDIFALEPLVLELKENLNIEEIIQGKKLKKHHTSLVDFLKKTIEKL